MTEVVHGCEVFTTHRLNRRPVVKNRNTVHGLRELNVAGKVRKGPGVVQWTKAQQYHRKRIDRKVEILEAVRTNQLVLNGNVVKKHPFTPYDEPCLPSTPRPQEPPQRYYPPAASRCQGKNQPTLPNRR